MANTITSYQSNLSFVVRGILTTSWSSVAISNDIERDQVITASNASVVLKTTDGKTRERMKVDIAGGTMTILKRWLDQSANEVEVTELKKERRPWAIWYITIFASQALDLDASGYSQDKYVSTVDFASNSHSGTETFTWKIVVSGANWEIDAQNADKPICFPNISTTERLALTAKPWDIVYDTTVGLFYQYKATWRASIDTWTTPGNADTTTAWSVQMATDSQVTWWDSIWSSWAYLVPTPAQIKALWYSQSQKSGHSYLTWESLVWWNAVFLEDVPWTASATNVQNISDVNANKRVAVPMYWSWLNASTINFNLAKAGTPTVALTLRLETDSSWPSGTLIDPAATYTVAQWTLTSSLADTWVGIWFANVDEDNGVTYDTTANTTIYSWNALYCNKATSIVSVNKDPSCTATTAYIFSTSLTLLASASFSTDTATLNYWVSAWTTVYICAWSWGSTYARRLKTGVSFPISNEFFNYTSGFFWGITATDAHWTAVYTTANYWNAWIRFTTNQWCKLYTVSFSVNNWPNTVTVALRNSSNTVLATRSTIWWAVSFDWYTLTSWATYKIVMYDIWILNQRKQFTWTWTSAKTNITFIWWYYSMVWWDVSAYFNVTSIETRSIDTPTTSYNIDYITVKDEVSLTENEKIRAVFCQGTYWSETVDGTNYYKIGYSTNDTQTRGTLLYNSSWSSPASTKFIYASSTLIKNVLLSKSDQTYTYKRKIVWVSDGTYAPWTTATVNTYRDNQQSWLTPLWWVLLTTTPWTLSASWWGTNVWTADSKTSFYITKTF